MNTTGLAFGILLITAGFGLLVWTLASNHRWIAREEYRYRAKHRTWDDHDDDNRPDSTKTR